MALTHLVREPDRSLLRFFLAFGLWSPSYRNHLKRVLYVEGTHLTEKYFDPLLVSYICDAQNHNFPIAFAFVELKNKDS